METRLRIMTAVAVVATLVAVGEGIALMRLAGRTPEPVVTQPATVPEATATAAAVVTPAAGGDAPGAMTVPRHASEPASAAPEATDTTTAGVDPASGGAVAGTGETASAAEAPEATTDEEPLSDEERAAKRTAEDKARMAQAMAMMAEASVNKMFDALQLTEAQRDQAAPVRETMCGIMLGMMAEPQKKVEALQQKAREMKETGRLTDEEIQQALAPERDTLLKNVLQGPAEMMVALDELAPILDAGQMQTLNQMKDQLRKSQEMIKKMFEQMM